MKNAVLSAVAGVGVLVAVPALAAEYFCKFEDRPTRTMIPADLLLTVDTEARSAQVIDGIIQQRFGEPLEAKVIDVNDTRVLVSWELAGDRNEVGQFTHAFRYRLNLIPARKQAQITGKVEGYSNHENVKGDCERRK